MFSKVVHAVCEFAKKWIMKIRETPQGSINLSTIIGANLAKGGGGHWLLDELYGTWKIMIYYAVFFKFALYAC